MNAGAYTATSLNQQLKSALEDPDVKCICGHFPLRPVIAESNAMVVTLFREPIARSISHYNHYSKRINEKHIELMKGIESLETSHAWFKAITVRRHL